MAGAAPATSEGWSLRAAGRLPADGGGAGRRRLYVHPGAAAGGAAMEGVR